MKSKLLYTHGVAILCVLSFSSNSIAFQEEKEVEGMNVACKKQRIDCESQKNSGSRDMGSGGGNTGSGSGYNRPERPEQEKKAMLRAKQAICLSKSDRDNTICLSVVKWKFDSFSSFCTLARDVAVATLSVKLGDWGSVAESLLGCDQTKIDQRLDDEVVCAKQHHIDNSVCLVEYRG